MDDLSIQIVVAGAWRSCLDSRSLHCGFSEYTNIQFPDLSCQPCVSEKAYNLVVEKSPFGKRRCDDIDRASVRMTTFTRSITIQGRFVAHRL